MRNHLITACFFFAASFSYSQGYPPVGPAGGDLSGSFPNPGVANINGSTIPASQPCLGSNSSKQIIAGTCGGGVSGSGTTGYFPEWMGPTALGNSPFDDGVTLAGTVSSSEPIAAPSEAIGAFLTSAGISVFGETLDVFASVPGGVQAVFWGTQDPTNSNDFSVLIPMFGYVPGSPGTLGNDFAGFGYSGTIDNAGNVTVAYMFFQSSLANGFDNILIDQAGDVGIGGSAMNNASINPQDGTLYVPVAGTPIFNVPFGTLVYSATGTALPSASVVGIGARAFVSDATLAVFGSAYTGGGTNKVPVYSDGTSWYIG